ncbi:MAG TPA: flavodoxin [Candidatus Limivivens intestinipullorum]|uniref:Flavodoxin n=1 Tax=Candidatus Limivivens intestinipullorum TaxID=2840858 RepID=A0A9D1ERM5_9FIRM|nr:flavodoxin [Candidatus Limivivens intestinipullorum]
MPAIQELCPDSNILEGLTANNLDYVEPWIESLGVLDDGETETEATSSTDSNILIAYFSLPEDIDTEGIDADAGASVVVDNGEVKGNVQYMAEIIQETIGGDLFRIETEETYPGDHDPLVDQAAQEQDEQALPALSAHIENLDQYDTILLGYPNWWADLPQPLYTFLEEYDLSGKTIIPFNSHNGSRFSNTIETIQELQPNATVIEDGFTINERDVPEAAEDVAQWLQGLGY